MPAMTIAQLTRSTDPRRIAARDRRLAAIHEAGHVAVARWRGVEAIAYIWPTDNGNDPTLKTWLGQTMLSRKTVVANSRLIAVAGAVAEHCWRHGSDPTDEWLEQWFWEQPEAMSETDWQMARLTPGEPDQRLMKAIRLVHSKLNPATGPLWPDACRVARDLIVKTREREELIARYAARSAPRQ